MKRAWMMLVHILMSPLAAGAAGAAEVGIGDVVGVKTSKGEWVIAQIERFVSVRKVRKANVMWAGQANGAQAGLSIQEDLVPVSAIRKGSEPVATLWIYPLAALHLQTAAQTLSRESFAVIEKKAGKRPKTSSPDITRILQAPRPTDLPSLIERYHKLTKAAEAIGERSLKERWLRYTTKVLALLTAESNRCLSPDFMFEADKAKKLKPQDSLARLKASEDTLAALIQEHARNKLAYRAALPKLTREQGHESNKIQGDFHKLMQRTADMMSRSYNAMHGELEKAWSTGLLFKPAAMRGCYPHFIHFSPDLNVKDQGLEALFDTVAS